MPITKTYYKVHRVFPDPDYFYLENISGSAANFNVNKNGTPASTDLAYSFDKVTWTDIHNGGVVTVADGEKIYLRSTTGLSLDTNNFISFAFTSICNTGGHIASLFNYLNIGSFTEIPSYGCLYLFNSVNTVHCNIDFAGVTTIKQHGLEMTWYQNSNLITVPDLSGIQTIETYGLSSGFAWCTSLQSGVDLSGVTNYDNYSINKLYYKDASLNDATYPNVSSYNQNSCYDWLQDTASTGVVRKPAGLTIPTNTNNGIPTGWTTEDY